VSHPLITLQKVAKHYVRGAEKIEVLHDLDLTIARGEFVALMGPSGSGKTTLLNMIAGLDRPTQGAIIIAEQRVERLSAAALTDWRAQHIGFIFQLYNLLPVLTAQRNVEVPLILTSLSSKQRRTNALAALRLVGLEDRAQHKPTQLSGGQQQRVAIARAIVADPPILVCDEPTGDLDRHNATEILNLLQLLNRELGKTIVMVTHDPLAAAYATRQLRMDKGRLLEGITGQSTRYAMS
jgi:putative ABC transport system ATP-binding protein